MGSLIDLQRWLYSGAVDALKGLATAGPTGAPALIATAFAFGLLHAVMPGHGKAVTTSRFIAGGSALEALASTCVLILVHVGSAVVIAWGGFALITRTIGGAGRAPALEAASRTMIVVVGIWLLWRALRERAHDHGERPSLALAVGAGLVPCPLTFFIMSYAIPRGLVGAGLFLVACFAAGMVVTVTTFPMLAVLLRTRLASLIVRTEGLRLRLARAVSVGAALAVVALGVWPALSG